MNLGMLVAKELEADPQHVMLLRHSNVKVAALEREGASVEEYTLVQPTNSRYDFFADGRVPAKYVVVIVYDHVHCVYRIQGVEAEGTTHSLASAAYVRFDTMQGHLPLPAKRFRATLVERSRTLGRPVLGWSSPRTPVARYGGRLFEHVEVSNA